MKTLTNRLLFVCACLLAFTVAANAQTVNSRSTKKGSDPATMVLSGTGKAAVIVVGSAAKVAWGTTKFVGKHVAAPIAFHAAPRIAVFMLKSSGIVAKQALPAVVRLALL